MGEQLNLYGSVIPCGGRGTRLSTLNSEDIPKSLFKVGGRELIRYSLDVLSPQLVKNIVFAVGHKSDEIRKWVQSNELPYFISFSEQLNPGVLGAIEAGMENIPEDSFIACNSDEVRHGLDLFKVLKFHERQGTLATMVVTYTNKLHRHRVIDVNPRNNIVLNTILKPDCFKDNPGKIGLVNAGFLIVEKKAADYFDPSHSHDWGGIIDPLCDAGQLSAYINGNIHYFNVGTPEEFQEAETFLRKYSREGNCG